MAETTQLGNYTLEDLAYLVSNVRPVTAKNLRRWLPWALIPVKSLYTKRDLSKLLFVAYSLNRVRDFELAHAKLREDLQLNPHRYQENQTNVTIDL